ncbi:MAG: DUF2806 domain-containing protein [Lachnospiraceae bacterium]|nr:DUF2806 domain-containing protein [Lachnospiraceae bacterium]
MDGSMMTNGININLDVKIDSKDIKEGFLALLNKLCSGVSSVTRWLIDLWQRSPKRIAVDEYISDIENNTELDAASKAVLMYNAGRDIKRMANVMSICNKASEKLLDLTNIDKVSKDWVDAFVGYAENISSEELQEIWSVILSRECNEPGSIPRALLSTLYMMEKQEAEDFQNLMRFCVRIRESVHPIIAHNRIDDYYNEYGLGSKAINRLETLGLINYDRNEMQGAGIMVASGEVIEYFDNAIRMDEIIEFDDADSNGEICISCGSVELSYIGEALRCIVVSDKVDGFLEDIVIPHIQNPVQHLIDITLEALGKK